MRLLLNRETNRNLRKAQKILRLGEKHGSVRMNQVCQQALEYQTLSISFFEGAIQQNKPIEEPILVPSPPVPGFLRSSEYFSYG